MPGTMRSAWASAVVVVLLGGAHVAAEEPPLEAAERRTVVAGEQYAKGGCTGSSSAPTTATSGRRRSRCRCSTSGPSRAVSRPCGSSATARARRLALKGADGRSYTFRPLLKDPTDLLPVELRESKARDFVQDQMASGHPAGHVMVGPLLDAVGILHNEPRLVIMPDDPALGEFRKDVRRAASGDIEEFTGTPGFGGTLETIDGEEMWKRLRESPAVRADSRAYLQGAPDRPADRRLGPAPQPVALGARRRERTRWQPIPEDRDQAFVRFEGAVIGLHPAARCPLLVKFGRDYSDLEGLTFDGWDVDKRILADLEWPAWDEIAPAR